MKVIVEKLQYLVGELTGYGLLNEQETQYALVPTSENFVFGQQLAFADSLHLHIHVANIDNLPQALFTNKGASIAKKEEGYVKYSFEGGINLIFSHIPVAKKENITLSETGAYLDHIGIDIRSEDKEAYVIFHQIPVVSARNDYFFVRQGDGKQPVACCHMQVKEKYWVYPNEHINYEFAYGPLVTYGTGFGIDLRPANPFRITQQADETACCVPVTAKPAIFI